MKRVICADTFRLLENFEIKQTAEIVERYSKLYDEVIVDYDGDVIVSNNED